MAKAEAINHVIDKMDEIQETYDYRYIGVRVSEYEFKKGEILNNSFIWSDGEMTDEELDGTCAIQLKDAELSNAYLGNHVALIGSDSMEYGQDLGEMILRNAEVLEVLA